MVDEDELLVGGDCKTFPLVLTVNVPLKLDRFIFVIFPSKSLAYTSAPLYSS